MAGFATPDDDTLCGHAVGDKLDCWEASGYVLSKEWVPGKLSSDRKGAVLGLPPPASLDQKESDSDIELDSAAE